ncbi:hypothetical protein [Streptomyces sp. NPDC048157]|uniref:hypothetical protein n=1 Tax=Streptomyces sp. NPDC048157 TaxID=3365503 RepID=UPI00371DDABF
MTTRKKIKPTTYAETLEALRKTRDAIKRAEKKKTEETAWRDELIAHAGQFAEAQGGVIAQSAGTTPARVSQIKPVRQARQEGAARAVREAKKAGVLGSTIEPPAKLTGAAAAMAAKLTEIKGVPGPREIPGVDDYAKELDTAAARGPRELPGIGETPVTIEHGSVSKRKWTKQRPRVTACAAPDGRIVMQGQAFQLPVRGRSAAAWLEVLPAHVERLVFVGDPVWHVPDSGQTMTDDVTDWLSAPLPDGWTSGRHFPHERHPVARFEHRGDDGSRRRVEIQHLGTWVPGSGVTDPKVAWHAFKMLREGVQTRFGGAGVEILGSPTTTGQDLWARTIPQNTEYPLMSAELRELIRTTSGQGRFELFTPPSVPEKLPSLHYYDCTFAYAGLTWGLPVGNPIRITAREYESAHQVQQKKWIMGRGRWHVRATVPSDWTHVGLLPCSGASGWEYPREPGRTFTAWASGSEIWIALQRGWHVEILDGVTWAEGKPLNTWRDKVVDLWRALGSMSSTASGLYAEAAALAAKMARSILLFTVGGFHSKGSARKGISGTEAAIPASAYRAEQTESGSWTWQADREESSMFLHPEWSAEVYGRMRARLLSGPNGVGALAVPLSAIVAFRSDAMMLTEDTGWANGDSTPGRFRRKGAMGPVDAPTSEAELLALRDAMEGKA